MKKIFFCTILFAMLYFNSHAQSMGRTYKTALGVKFYPGAISLKSFTSDKIALEGLGYFFNYGFRLTGLYEIHGDINGAEGLKWYAGGGGHIGAWNNTWKTAFPQRNNGLMIGVDGVIGLDYKVNEVPLNVSLDWQPSFNIVGYNYFEGGWGGLAIRYTF